MGSGAESPRGKPKRRCELGLGMDEVACIVLHTFFEKAEREGKSTDFLMRGVPYSASHLRSEQTRMDWAAFARFMANAGALWDEKGLNELGHDFVYSPPMRVFRLIAKSLFSVTEVYRWMFDLDWGPCKEVFLCVDSSFEEVGPGEAKVHHFVHAGYQACPEFFKVARGAVSVLPRVCGGRMADVELELSGQRSTYHVRFKPQLSLAARVRRAFSLPFGYQEAAAALKDRQESLSQRQRELYELVQKEGSRGSATPTFGNYRLESRLAIGSIAEVFVAHRADEPPPKTPVVIKRLLPQLSSCQEVVDMLTDEARVAIRLQHPNIVQVKDYGAAEGLHYIAMEHVDGVDLRRLWQAAVDAWMPLNSATVATLGVAICRGLDHAHCLRDQTGEPLEIVHRDVSPDNVVLGYDGTVKVTDFGIAKAAARATRTSTGLVKGKAAYMAPEQARGEPVDARSDQFAVGVVLWECLTGRHLFTGSHPQTIMQQVIDAKELPLSEPWVPVPSGLEAVVMRMLAYDPKSRYPNLDAAAAALRPFMSSTPRPEVAALVSSLCPRDRMARRTLAVPSQEFVA